MPGGSSSCGSDDRMAATAVFSQLQGTEVMLQTTSASSCCPAMRFRIVPEPVTLSYIVAECSLHVRWQSGDMMPNSHHMLKTNTNIHV